MKKVTIMPELSLQQVQWNQGSYGHLSFSPGVLETVVWAEAASAVEGIVVIKKSLTHPKLYPGIHHGCVLPPDVGWWTAEVRRPNWDPTAKQPDGQQDLDAGHVFPEWQEVDLSQHDHPQQAVSHHAERNYPLHHEVNSIGQRAPNPAKTRIERRPGKKIKQTDIQEYAQTWKEIRSPIPKTRYLPFDSKNRPGKHFKQTWLQLLTCSKVRYVVWKTKNNSTWVFHIP